ncbi:MAG TPA: integrase, partial [Gammaproteobacteria bacterium]|nr:integrase [Gammaproteobacteria bacterium]
EDNYGLLSADIKAKLLKMSPATLDRLLKSSKIKYKRRGLCGTKPGYLLKNQIPIKTDHWDVTCPGFMEADSVAHCGNSLAGEFIWSITLTDIKTGWTEIRAVWNKGAEGVVNQIRDIEKKLPFQLLGFDCDNGSEFLNWHLVRYFTEGRTQGVNMTRSRPYRKNDNAHVEQKNWTHVRHLFGYDRFDDRRLVGLMNDVYQNEWSLYQNHFMPSQKLLSKEKINSKYRRKYEKAKTPYQRLLESPQVDNEIKVQKELLHETLNPFELKKSIERKIKNIFRYTSVNKNPRKKL